jgi:endonuclease YncB( thermonuclease family)
MSPFLAKVDRVIDGDTVWVRVRIRTRDSSPGGSSKAGQEATAALARTLRRGADIEVAPIVTDQYGRIVGTIRKL